MLSDDKKIVMFTAGAFYLLLICLCTLFNVPHGALVSGLMGAVSGLVGYAARQAYLRRSPGA